MIIFLDADDILLPDVCCEIVEVLDPSVSKVQWLLRRTDESLQPLRWIYPTARGFYKYDKDAVTYITKYSWYPTPPTSGNAFSRWYLDKIFPLQEDKWKIYADFSLLLRAPFYGKIKSINKILGYYRQHYKQNTGQYKISDLYIQTVEGERILREECARLNLSWSEILIPRDYRILLANMHNAETSRLKRKIALKGAYSASRYPYYSLNEKLLYLLWFILAWLFPSSFISAASSLSLGRYYESFADKFRDILTVPIKLLKTLTMSRNDHS